jgi:hypothetical protein
MNFIKKCIKIQNVMNNIKLKITYFALEEVIWMVLRILIFWIYLQIT